MVTTQGVTLRLSQDQRRALGSVLRFARRPPAITRSRWTVLQMSAASSIADWELAALQDSSELGKLNLASFLRAVDQSGREEGAPN